MDTNPSDLTTEHRNKVGIRGGGCVAELVRAVAEERGAEEGGGGGGGGRGGAEGRGGGGVIGRPRLCQSAWRRRRGGIGWGVVGGMGDDIG